MFHFYILPCFRKDNIFIPWNNDWLNWLYKFMSFVFLLHFSMCLVCLFVLFFFFHFFDMLRMECRWLFCCAMLVMLRADWALRWSWGIFLIKFNHTNFDCGEPKLEKDLLLVRQEKHCIVLESGMLGTFVMALFFSSQANWVNQCISIFPYRYEASTSKLISHSFGTNS